MLRACQPKRAIQSECSRHLDTMSRTSCARGSQLPLLLGAVLLLQAWSASALAVNSSGNSISTKAKRNVCLVYYQAIVYCDPDKDPSTYSGYEVELFRKTAEYVANTGHTEWAADNYTFTCTDWDTMMSDLLLPDADRTCDVGVAGISATSDRMDLGYKFTYPTYESGRQIMIFAQDTQDPFLFLKPFEATVWLLVMATSVFVGIAVMLAEVPIRRIIRAPEPALDKYMNLQWASTAMLLQAVQQFSVKSVGGRIIILGYAFMVLILVNAYIAVLSSQLTVTSINLNIKGLSDLTTKPVGIFEADLLPFKRFSLQFMEPLPWNNAQDEAAMLSKLRSGQVAALILDKPFVEYQAASTCDLYTVGDTVLPVNLGFAFPGDTSLDYVQMFSMGITVMEEQGVTADLKVTYIQPPGGCPSKDSGALATAQITLPQIAGLWLFLGAACVFGYGFNTSAWLWHKFKTWRGMDDDENVDAAGSMRSAAGSIAGSRNQVLPSNQSMSGRTMSLVRNNPDMSWLSMGDATTTEECLELLGAQVQQLDKKMRNIGNVMEQRFNMLHENLFGGQQIRLESKGQVLEPGMEALPSFSPAIKAKRGNTENGEAVGRTAASGSAVVAFSAGAPASRANPVTSGPQRAVSFSARVAEAQGVLSPQPPAGTPPRRQQPEDAVLTLQ